LTYGAGYDINRSTPDVLRGELFEMVSMIWKGFVGGGAHDSVSSGIKLNVPPMNLR